MLIQHISQIQSRYDPDTNAILILIQIQLSDTVQMHSRRGCHSSTHSNSASRYSSDTLQTQKPFWYSFKFYFQKRVKYNPLMDIILVLNLTHPLFQCKSTRGLFWHFLYSHQQSFLDGICKPISNNFSSPVQIASLGPFPTPSTTTSWSANFWAL